MDVYLFELDSVRTSELEIKMGQEALYEEIVKNGNRVVLSMNQLTDSKAFLSLLSIKEKEKNNRNKYSDFADLLEIFEKQIILVHGFSVGDNIVNTPSKYIQIGLKNCLDQESMNFIYSSLPIRFNKNEAYSSEENREMRKRCEVLLEALRYSDISLIEERMNLFDYRKLEVDSDDIKKYKTYHDDYAFLYRFAKVVLLISSSYRPIPLEESKVFIPKTYTYFMDLVEEALKIGILEVTGADNKRVYELLKSIDDSIENISNKQKRSVWLTKLSEIQKAYNEREIDSVKKIIHLVYNYTVEFSMVNVSKHYKIINGVIDEEDFLQDFNNRLANEMNLEELIYKNKTSFNMIDMTKAHFKSFNWNRANRLMSDYYKSDKSRKLRGKQVNNLDYTYEENQSIQEGKWKRFITRHGLAHFGILLLYLLIYLGINYLINLGQDGFENLFESDSPIQGILISVISMVVFGIVSSIISIKTGVPDIIDTLKNFFITIDDLIAVRMIKRVAYRRK